jgi:CubicO group peptidase (beta-lactamase class C family)
LHWLFERVGGIVPFSQSRLTTPFDLDKTAFSFPDQMIASGRGFDGRVQPPWHFDAMTTSMGLKSSMNDLIAFLKVISPKLISDTPPLTSSLRKELKALDKADEYKVIDGWFLIQSGDELIYYHTGRTGGHQVSIAFIPEKRKGVVVISNGALGSNELSLLVLNMINRAK